MVTFRNNSNGRRNNYRRNDRNYKNSSDRSKFNHSFSNNDSFQRKSPGRNNHNAPKLIEKYNNLAREALSTGDKILSENYFQHADHFTRILNEREAFKKDKYSQNSTLDKDTDVLDKDTDVLDKDSDTKNNTSENFSEKKIEKLDKAST